MAVELITSGATQGYNSGSSPVTFDSPDVIAGDTGIVLAWCGDGRHVLGTPTWDGVTMQVGKVTLTNDPNSGNSGIWFLHHPSLGVNDVYATGYNHKHRAYRMRNCIKDNSVTIVDSEGGFIWGGGSCTFSLDLDDERNLVVMVHGQDNNTTFVGEGTEILHTTTPNYIFAATCDWDESGNGVADGDWWDWGGSEDGSKAGVTFGYDPSIANRMILVMSTIKDKLGIMDTNGFKLKNGLFQQEPELVTI